MQGHFLVDLCLVKAAGSSGDAKFWWSLVPGLCTTCNKEGRPYFLNDVKTQCAGHCCSFSL